MSEEKTGRMAKWLSLYLWVVAIFSLLAFAAAVMPESWMIKIAFWLGIKDFPDVPLTYYLARNLSLMYGFVAVGLLVLIRDLNRYMELVGYLALGTMAFGAGQLIVNAMSGLPIWWVVGEGGSTIFGGALMAWLQRGASAGR